MDSRKSSSAMLTEAELDTLFRAADAEAPLPSGDLMARILADADAAQAQPVPAAVAVAAPAALGGFAALREMLGGWAGMSGLAGAVAAGLMIGVVTPDALLGYAEAALGTGAASFTEYVPSLDGVTFDG